MLSETMPKVWSKNGERMKVAVTSSTKSIDSAIDERFARCNFFVIIDTDSMEYEFFSNEAITSSSGAGVKAAQELIDKKVEAVITGNIGPNAFDVLNKAGIKIFKASGSIKEAIENFKEGKLKEMDMANVGRHGGMR